MQDCNGAFVESDDANMGRSPEAVDDTLVYVRATKGEAHFDNRLALARHRVDFMPRLSRL